MDEVRKGKNPNDEKCKIRQDMTIKTFFDDVYVPQHCELSLKPLSRLKNQMLFKNQLAPLHNRKMLDITKPDIERLHKAIGAQSIYAANRALALIKHMYSRAIAWGFPEGNPAKGVAMFREQSRRRFLLPDEIPRFYAALQAPETHENFRNYVILSLYCGQRRGNMLSLRWADVDFTYGVIYIADTKNNEPQSVPLPSQAIDLLRDMKAKSKSEWLFPSRLKPKSHLFDPREPWNDLLRRAGIEDFRIHDLRRTFGSMQAQLGANETIIQKALGDKSRAAAAVYMRVGLDPVRDSIQRMADEVERLALGRPAGEG